DYLPSAGFVLVFVPSGREAVCDSPLPFVGASSEKIPLKSIATVRAVDPCDPCTAAIRRHELDGGGRSRVGSGRPGGGGGHASPLALGSRTCSARSARHSSNQSMQNVIRSGSFSSTARLSR